MNRHETSSLVDFTTQSMHALQSHDQDALVGPTSERAARLIEMSRERTKIQKYLSWKPSQRLANLNQLRLLLLLCFTRLTGAVT